MNKKLSGHQYHVDFFIIWWYYIDDR